MHEDNGISSVRLEEQALLLLIETARLSATEREQRLCQWEQRSAAHREALAQAQSEWALFGKLQREPLAPGQRSRLGLQALWASSKDHPLRAGSALSVLAALLLWAGAPGDQRGETLPGPLPEQRLSELARAVHSSDSAQYYRTARGEQREIRLSDGSSIWLNWNTEILVLDTDREIHVDVIIGDVMFSIARGKQQPLVVHAGQTFAYAADTEFAIHSHGPDDAFFQVKRGSLTIAGEHQAQGRELAAAQQSFYYEGVGGTLSETALDSIAAWREGKLVFDDRPLTEILGELAHFTERPIQIGPIAASETSITATYALTEADAAVLQLADAHQLELLRSADDALLIRSIDGRRR